MSQFRKRASRISDSNVGQKRYELYKSAFERIDKAIREGFYLEAISLEESLISDRLESYLTWLTTKDYGFRTLGELQRAIKNFEKDKDLRQIVLSEMDDWRKARNKASHEMVKLQENQNASWKDRTTTNQKIAKDGLELVRKIDRKTRQLRRS